MIFADSSYFIALVRKGDRWHDKAVNISEDLNESIMVSDLVVSESVTLVGSLEGGKKGKILYEFFADNCQIEFVDRDILGGAMETFLQYDGTLSIADSTSIELMKKFNIKMIVSFDGDFDKVGGIKRMH